ncbi:MAG: DUF5063 domain-containing protein [Nocardioidaceae bacterium]|nr:DUF5063 domain-containing protein [Nocardioidaceae bacterium]MDQ3164889.1 DUF5063 domain-containing protein [Actinomycetota bacterium]
MSEHQPVPKPADHGLDSDVEDLAQAVADQVESFLLAVREIAASGDSARAVPLLLLEVSQLLFAGARLGVQIDFVPSEKYEPDAGPDPDLDRMREALAELLGHVDEYTEVFDPYEESPELVASLISDDVSAIAGSVAHGLRHHRAGRVLEALWWWQFSYVASWGAEASGALRALQSVVAHDRLDSDTERTLEMERVAVAEAVARAEG